MGVSAWISFYFLLINQQWMFSHAPCLWAFYVFILILLHILAVITTLDGPSNEFWCGPTSSASDGLTLKMKALQSCGTAVRLYQSTRRNIKEDPFHLWDKLTSHCLRKKEEASWRQMLIPKHGFYCRHLPSSVCLMQHVSAGSLASFLRDQVAGSSCCEEFHRIGCTWTDDGETN